MITDGVTDGNGREEPPADEPPANQPPPVEPPEDEPRADEPPANDSDECEDCESGAEGSTLPKAGTGAAASKLSDDRRLPHLQAPAQEEVPMPLQMRREEREAFLADVHVGVLSIENPGHGPLSVPIWYDYKHDVGLWFITSRSSRKGVALDRAGRFTLVAQTEQAPYKYVSVEGPIVEVRPADKEKDLRPMAQRYLGIEVGSAYADAQPADDGGHVYVMRPERWLTVDYAKLTSGG